jgi:colicin import membrane protein
MLRKRENPDSLKAGMYALAVHVVLLVGMLVSFNWKAAHPVMNVTEVELWDKLPAPKTADLPKPEPKPVLEEKPEPKVEPKPILEEKPKPEEPKVDIELEKKKKELELKREKELTEKVKKEEDRKKLAQQMREEDLQEKATEKQAKADKEKALRKLKEDMLNENGADDAKAASAANASIIGEYRAKIQAKIKNNVNKSLCGDGSPEILIEINVLPTGQIGGTPRLTKSSGNDACDGAVERAIIASEPLPLPDDAALKAQFKSLKLKFRPND